MSQALLVAPSLSSPLLFLASRILLLFRMAIVKGKMVLTLAKMVMKTLSKTLTIEVLQWGLGITEIRTPNTAKIAGDL